MKKIILLLGLISAVQAFSQNAAAVFKSDSIVYYGLDFSNCRLMGDFGTADPNTLKTKMFVEWNDVIVDEQTKYDLKKTFEKSKVHYDIKPVSAQNAKTDEAQIKTTNSDYFINPQIVQKSISAYGPGDKKAGIGLVFVVETLDKTIQVATAYVTFFDIATKKVLFTEKMRGTAGGIGLKNYWAKSFFGMMKDITKVDYAQWKKKYGEKK